MPAPETGAFVTLPRGLRVRLAVASGAEPLPAVVRAVEADRITLGVLDLPSDAQSLKGRLASIAAQIHGRMYELDASILDVEIAPPALVVTLPVEARRSQRRQFYRLNVSLAARALWREGSEDAPDGIVEHRLTGVLLLDIGGGGAQLRVHEDVPAGAALAIEFSLEPGTPPLQVMARALTCRPEQRTDAYRINTEFVGIARRTQERIVRFIYQQQMRLSRRRSA